MKLEDIIKIVEMDYALSMVIVNGEPRKAHEGFAQGSPLSAG